MDEKHDRIRVRAFEIWQRAGQPEGSHMEHWHQAMQEIEAEDARDAAAGRVPNDAQDVSGAAPALARHSKDVAGAKARGKAKTNTLGDVPMPASTWAPAAPEETTDEDPAPLPTKKGSLRRR
jgi:hypothetical protein